jgi:hypothetical protein
MSRSVAVGIATLLLLAPTAGATPAPRNHATVIEVVGDAVTIDMGANYGITVGWRAEVYLRDTHRPLAHGVVVRVKDNESDVRLSDPPRDARSLQRALVRLRPP